MTDQILDVAAIEPLSQDPVIQRGVPFTSTVQGILPGEHALFLGSLTGTTPFGPTLPPLGGLHINLRLPIFLLGTDVADADGIASIDKTFAPWFPPLSLATQVVVIRGSSSGSIKSNVVEGQIQP